MNSFVTAWDHVISLAFGTGDDDDNNYYLAPCKANNYSHITNCRV